MTYDVDALPLREICDRHVGDREVHFLKVDVEGHEAAVLRGMDFRRYRPWILVVEATEPLRHDILTHEEWEEGVLRAGYAYAGCVLPNRYYVAEEHADLARYFTLEPDDYEPVRLQARREELEREVEALTHRLKAAEAAVEAATTARQRPSIVQSLLHRSVR